MKRLSSSTDQQSPQDVTEMNPDQCRHDGLRLPADGHSNSTQSLLPTEETQQQSASEKDRADSKCKLISLQVERKLH